MILAPSLYGTKLLDHQRDGHPNTITWGTMTAFLLLMMLFVFGCRATRAWTARSVPKYPTTTLRVASTLDDSPARTSTTTQQLPTVILKRNKISKDFRNGNQLVFTKSIIKHPSSLEQGDLVHVVVESDKEHVPHQAIGYGVFNPLSLYRIRILSHRLLQPVLYQQVTKEPVEAVAHIVDYHLRNAIALRKSLGLPNETTDTYRLLNGEGDHLSGLAVDVIQNVLVVMSSASWCEIHRMSIERVLRQHYISHDIIWRQAGARLAQDGFIVDTDSDSDTDSPMVLSRENGLVYETFPFGNGQKTGVYCDQRDNRASLAHLCTDKRVLDLCCFTGGFSLNAAQAGASFCLGVDSSPVAIEACRVNAQRNGFVNVEFLQSDITTYLQSTDVQYDVVVLDPPKLAPSAKSLDKARRKYHALNRDALNVVSDEGGLLMTCSCSAAMTQANGGEYFLQMVQGAALSAGRQVTLLRVSGAAPCHTQSPISFPAGNYLTAALFAVHPR